MLIGKKLFKKKAATTSQVELQLWANAHEWMNEFLKKIHVLNVTKLSKLVLKYIFILFYSGRINFKLKEVITHNLFLII